MVCTLHTNILVNKPDWHEEHLRQIAVKTHKLMSKTSYFAITTNSYFNRTKTMMLLYTKPLLSLKKSLRINSDFINSYL